MGTTARLKLPYPDEFVDPWYDAFVALVQALDFSLYTIREDRNIILSGGGTVAFDATSGTLSWTAPIYLLSSVTGYRWRIDAGSKVLTDGQLAYITIARAPQSEVAYTLIAGNVTPNEPNGDSQILLCVRSGARVHFRDGFVISDGEAGPLFTASASQHRVPVRSTAISTLVTAADFHIACTAGSITITLPATPSDGDTYEVKDTTGVASGANITVAGNGHNIDGAATLVMSTAYQFTRVRYIAASTRWSKV